ncbi:hypothetical protein CVT24_011300 [Panaeolus cyanescens]|uniref:Fibronectin type-III domain-containing protein n=1 Tax=Panaeolus cyanescens TaxID=181874 RepID=A0A409WQJ5_9AGAR|nr:hypothetical protein CVT24_011300 [Panaeolus cyanescens]
MAQNKAADSFTFTVGKLDAGMAILLGERAHLIEFPSILLPPGATTGSIVNIAVHQNHAEEKKRENEFWDLQERVLQEYGHDSPEPPILSVRNVTQTSVTLEWAPIKLATARLRSLDIYRNEERLSSVPSPLTNTTTKHSGMAIDTEYRFQLILRTTAGTFPSNVLRVRTHTMQDTSGIRVCFGNVQDKMLLENAKEALHVMGAKWTDNIQIDTSHFVCTTPAAIPVGSNIPASASQAPGVMYQRALQLSIPVVQPTWILACHAEKRMVPIAQYYLGASTPSTAAFGSSRPQSMSQANLPYSPASPPPGQNTTASRSVRSSMPPPSRAPGTPPTGNLASAFINQPNSAQEPNTASSAASRSRQYETLEEQDEDPEVHTAALAGAPQPGNGQTSAADKRRSTPGVMNREFKFPPDRSPVTSPAPGPESQSGNSNSSGSQSSAARSKPRTNNTNSVDDGKPAVITPTSIEVPAPPPMEKEKNMSRVSLDDSGEDDVGDTVDIPLN